ncbi:hypothetical protein [Aromatoleum bremense]|uniref:VCBS repeat-containing protein n=1 Tax=Aromatoleum bremense TaxID=76115 RepID=A0ABX1NXI1_9RHOO|nr:hypothetical protein [Aromatoleum bremense]NMG16250.1 hypothetical protein [Aromatoleum bremense]QTQ30105.1 Uncharacterized protein pbN1_01120 [Aromatoleum bremense]
MQPPKLLPYATAFVAILHAGVVHAGDEKSTALAAALFAHVPAASLPAPDRVAIADLTPLTLKGGRVVSKLPGCDREPMDAEAQVVDLNGDRQPEVFVMAGNTCTSGMTGISVRLYARQRDGTWIQLLDVIAPAYRVLPSTSHGWRDLALASRTSSCVGVWRLGDDGRYRYTRSEAADGGPCPDRH